MGKKPKKEKVQYYDDGRTISDMSGVGGPSLSNKRGRYVPRSTAKERWETYKTGVKMMFGPMLVVIVGLMVIYMILYVLFLLLA